MNPDNNVIITEDGRRLEIKDGLITGTEDPAPGLAYETGNILDEDNRLRNEGGGACPVGNKTAGDDRETQDAISGNPEQ